MICVVNCRFIAQLPGTDDTAKDASSTEQDTDRTKQE